MLKVEAGRDTAGSGEFDELLDFDFTSATSNVDVRKRSSIPRAKSRNILASFN